MFLKPFEHVRPVFAGRYITSLKIRAAGSHTLHYTCLSPSNHSNFWKWLSVYNVSGSESKFPRGWWPHFCNFTIKKQEMVSRSMPTDDVLVQILMRRVYKVMTMRMISILRENFAGLKQKNRWNSLKSPRLSRNGIYWEGYPPPDITGSRMHICILDVGLLSRCSFIELLFFLWILLFIFLVLFFSMLFFSFWYIYF